MSTVSSVTVSSHRENRLFKEAPRLELTPDGAQPERNGDQFQAVAAS